MLADAIASPAEIESLGWAEVRRFYDDLAGQTVDGRWLRSWSRLEDLIAEAANLAEARFYGDTADQALRATHLRLSSEIKPAAAEYSARLIRQLIESRYSEPSLDNIFRGFRNQISITSRDNVPLLAEDASLQARVDEIEGGLTTSWDGEEIPISALLKFLQSSDREIRRKAWMAQRQALLQRRRDLDDILSQQVALRNRIARNVGLDTYSEYGHRMRARIDMKLADIDRIVENFEEVWVPLARSWRANHARRLGVPAPSPWDLLAPSKARPLNPYRNSKEMIAIFQRIFTALHPRLGEHFHLLRRERLLDVDFRPHSPPIALNSRLHFSRRSRVFMSLPPTDSALGIFSHECGHAFHFLECAGYVLHWQRLYGSMVAELASTSMQLLILDHLSRSKGGFYQDDDARTSAALALRETIWYPLRWTPVYRFERWMYDNPAASSTERSRVWRRLLENTTAGEDWTGLEPYVDTLQAGHVYPFYFVDYVIAQIGALQVWRKAQTDPKGALDAYLSALALGNTATAPEIYAAAGAKIDLSRAELAELANLVLERIEELEA